MKLTVFFMSIAFMHVHASGYAQRITLSETNVPLSKVFKEIKKQSDYLFWYENKLLQQAGKVDIEVNRASLEETLDRCFHNLPLTYSIVGKTIVVTATGVRDPDGTRQQQVSGQVVDGRSGEPLPGVSVIVKGTPSGTSTDLDGRYVIENPAPDAILAFSFIGYKSREIPVNGRTEINIALSEDLAVLDEIVVVGYGTQQRQKVISGVSSINTEDLGLMDLNTPSTGNLLKGRVAGVLIQDGTGAAGSPPVIRVRGISSINAGVEPLVVIDGFPVGTGIPQTLNPDDIENISVLKDASATAIYGARGSNGVVLIETTNAKEGKGEFSYNTYFNIRQLPDSWRPRMLNAEEAVIYNIERIEELDAFNNASTPTPIPEIFLDGLQALEQGELKGYDWLDEFIQEGLSTLSQNHNITYSSGTDRFRAVISGSFLDGKSVLPDDDYKRLSLRTKFDADLTERIKMGINLNGVRAINNRVPSDGTRSGLWAAITASPLLSPYDEQGNLIPFMPGDAPGFFARPNPIFEAREIRNQTINRDLQANIDFDVEILEGLHYTPRFFMRQQTRRIEQFTPSTIGRVATAQPGNLFLGGPPQNNSGSLQNVELENWGVDNLLRYTKTSENHHFNVILGHSIQKQTEASNRVNGSVFPSDEIINYAEAAEITSNNNYAEWALLAGFGQIKYDYQNKYLAEFNFRREGSSRLGVNNRFGSFPSGAIGWRISNENFFPRNIFLHDLLMKGSFGRTGNSDIGNFEALGQFGSIRTVFGGNVLEGKFLSTIENQDLSWETALQWQVGATLAMFDNSINVDIELWKKTTKDMLFNVNTPRASGFGIARVNIGEMENRGLDVTINTFKEFGDGFQWNSNLNISWMSNEVTRMPEQIDRIRVGGRGGTHVTMVGEEIGAFWGFIRLGLFDEETANDPNTAAHFEADKIPGTNRFMDLNGDGIVDRENDMTVIGSPHPDVIIGFNNQFTYRNFSFSVLLTSMLGYDVFPAIRDVDLNQVARWNVSKSVLDRWKSPEDPGNGFVPRSEVNAGSREWMDDWLEPGDHLWIKNIRVSYSVPARIAQSVGMSQLRFTFTADNVARFDNYSGMNPEVTGGNPIQPGVDHYVNPVSRSFSLGVNVTF